MKTGLKTIRKGACQIILFTVMCTTVSFKVGAQNTSPNDALTAENFDKDGNGFLSPSEQVKALQSRIQYAENVQKTQVNDDIDGWTDTVEDGFLVPKSVEDFDREYWNDELRRNTTFFDDVYKETFLKDFVLRRSIDSLTFHGFEALKDPKSATFARASGAVFSFNGNPDSGDTTLTARGIFAYVTEQKGPLFIIPSVSFDRVNGDSSSVTEVNELSPRLTFAYRIDGDAKYDPNNPGKKLSGLFDSHQLTLSAAYSTDFDFDSNQALVEFEWFPEIYNLGQASGAYFPDFKNRLFEYRWRPSLYTQVGDVGGTGGNANLEQGSFSRIGPRVRLEIWPSAPELQRLSFTAQYASIFALDGDTGETSLLELGIAFQLDRQGRFVLEPFYRTGENLITQQEVDELGISLTVKF